MWSIPDTEQGKQNKCGREDAKEMQKSYITT